MNGRVTSLWGRLGASLMASGLFLGCSSEPAGPTETTDPEPENPILASEYCQAPRPGETPLRRLSNSEYRHSLEAIGISKEDVFRATQSLPSEPVSLGFRNGARTLNVDSLMAQEYARIAEHFRDRVKPSCSDEQEPRACAEEFVSGLGRRLFRRPLTEEEMTDFLALFDQATAGGDPPEEAVAWIVEAMLQSADFLYRVEIPEQDIAKVTGYEMASRLAFTFWQAPPDEELLLAAEAGELETPQQVELQARRLLRDGRALRVYEFFEQWLDLDELGEVTRNPDFYPDLPAQLGELLRTESQAFISSLLGRGDATLAELLTADYTFANQALAEHYGLSGPETSVFEQVSAPGRSGILTQGMLAVQDGTTRTSIVRRGLKIRTDFLCQLVPAPPDTVDLTLDGLGPDLTQAERLEAHRSNTACAACHSLMDPIGVLFEDFDAVGRSREVDENGAPVLTSGAVEFSRDLDGAYDGVVDLGQAMAGSEEVAECYLTQNFRFFFGKDAKQLDMCSQAQLAEFFEDSEQSLAELFVGLATTDAFLYKAGLSDPPEPSDSGELEGGM